MNCSSPEIAAKKLTTGVWNPVATSLHIDTLWDKPLHCEGWDDTHELVDHFTKDKPSWKCKACAKWPSIDGLWAQANQMAYIPSFFVWPLLLF